mgnify:CR=1 FL=1
MIRKIFCSAAKHTAVFAVVLFLLWLLLFLSALIPNDMIRDNMVRSADTYKEHSTYEFVKGNKFNSIADYYADALWLNIAWNIGEGNSLKSVIQTDYYDGEGLGENAGLYLTITENKAPNTDYTRYWHGTAMFIRFGHLITDVEGIKLIGFVAFLLLVGLSLFILARKKHRDLAIMLALSLAAVQIWNIRLSMEYQPGFILAFVLVPLFLILERRDDKWLTILSVVSGTAVAFFDFLTTETVTILIPLALVIAVRTKENRLGSLKENLLLLLKCGICWVLSYGGAFIVKWLIASMVTNTNAFETALSSVAERMGNKVEMYADKPKSILSAVAANLSMLFGSEIRVDAGRTALGIIFLVLILLSVWYLFRGKDKKSEATIILIVLGAVVLIRCLALNNHSYLHCFFTYRALVTTIFALLAAMWLNIELPHKKRRRK